MKSTSRELPTEYGHLFAAIKTRVRSAQLAAFRAVNKEVVATYWDIWQMKLLYCPMSPMP